MVPAQKAQKMISQPLARPKKAPIQEPKPMVILTSPAPMPPMT